MKKFSDFGVKPDEKGFVGDSIKITKLLDKQIIVMDYAVKPSKFEGKGECLHLQVKYDEDLRVVFTGATNMIDVIKKIPKEELPFQATIIKENGRYQFT